MTDLAWLLRLRWVVLAVEVWIVASEGGMHRPPIWPLVAIGVVQALSNAAAYRRRASPALAAALMAVDVLALTGVLRLTGGAFNPYGVFYLVYVALAVITLPPGWAWGLVALSVGGYASLFGEHDAHMAHDMGAHLRGMWVAFAITAVAVVWFAGRVNAALRAREAALAEARRAATEAERLASLGTLAAGAAHELATPLGTIAIAARELGLSLPDAPREVLDDVALIAAEVRRCQRILERLAADAGRPAGEGVREVEVETLLARALEGVDAARVDLHLAPALAGQTLRVFERAWTEPVRSVVDNALLADPAGRVRVEVDPAGDGARVVVSDTGPGMEPEVLARATEPFFTTRPAGQGMGLGLFLARTLTEGAGGRLHLASTPGAGTTVTLTLRGEPA